MIRCMVVDDSATFREVLKSILSKDSEIQVVGEAADGEEAVRQAVKLRPDVITLDVHMPRQNGLDAMREIMEVCPSPIVVISAARADEAERITFQALALGAVDVVGKPRAEDGARFAQQADEIRRTVRIAARSHAVPRRSVEPSRPMGAPIVPAVAPVCIGMVASTGGPQALQRLISALPASFPIPILVVQHISEGFTEPMVGWLAGQSALEVKVATEGEALRPGMVRFSPGGRHLVVSGGRIRLDPGPAVRGFRPSGSVLLASLARDYGAAACGLILTGMGEDGVSGLRMIRDRGGLALAQGKESCSVYGMPKAALEANAAERALELDQLAQVLVQLGGVEASARRKRLLLVDDSETILSLERHLLGRDYELYVARDGKEAVELAGRHLPDGILMDFHMPVMNGVEAVKSIRRDNRLRSVPVIMISSETHEDITRSFRGVGCAAVLPKPIDARALLECVKSHVPR